MTRPHRFHDSGVSIEPSEIHDAERGVRIRVSGDYVPVEDLLLPTWIEMEIEGDEEPSSLCRVEVRDGRPEVVEFRVWSRPGQREVRSADLRAAQPSALIELLAAFAVVVEDTPDDDDYAGVVWSFESGSEAQDEVIEKVLRTRAGNGFRSLTPAFLERVAEIYRANLDHAPTEAVRRHFVVQPRTASEYVQRARRAGLLPPTTPGKKKG